MYRIEKFIAINACLCGVMLSILCGWLAWIGAEQWSLLLGYWLAGVCICYAVLGPLCAEYFNVMTGCLVLSVLCPAIMFYLVQRVVPVEYYLFSGAAVCLIGYQWMSWVNAAFMEERESEGKLLSK